MNEEPEEKETINDSEEYESYLRDLNSLDEDFSDLDDLDLEELKEIQDAITKVREWEESKEAAEEINVVEEISESQEIKEQIISDFSDIGEIDLTELQDIKEAIELVKKEEEGDASVDSSVDSLAGKVSEDLEQRIKQELLKKKELEKEEVVTKEKFIEYASSKRTKIWYHSLYYLTFQVEDHTASKSLLYEELKSVVSKSAIDDIPEHQFYFGLGYLLRLTLNENKIVRYMGSGKFKVNVNVDAFKEILTEVGEPISTRPVIAEDEKKKMFKNFLDDDFLDI